MQYLVYTDSACSPKRNKVTAAYMIKTKYKYIGSGVNIFEGTSIAVGESIAVGLAIEALLKENILKNKDNVIIYTDCKSVVDFFAKVREPNTFPKTKDKAVKLTWKKLQELSEACECTFVKIKAHDKGANGNKVEYRLAKYALRYLCEVIE